MKHLLFLFALVAAMFGNAQVNAQSSTIDTACASLAQETNEFVSLWDALAWHNGVDAATWTVAEFRAEARAYAAYHGLAYDMTAKGNVAILHHISCINRNTGERIGYVATSSTNVAGKKTERKIGNSNIDSIYQATNESIAALTTDTTGMSPAQVDFYTNIGANMVSSTQSEQQLTTSANVVDSANFDWSPAINSTNRISLDESSATCSALYSTSMTNHIVDSVNNINNNSETAGRRVFIRVDIGRDDAISLLDYYIETRADGLKQRHFEWVWRRFIEQKGDKLPHQWGVEAAAQYERYNSKYWSWYWFTFDKAVREQWLMEVGENIQILPVFKAGGGVPTPTSNGHKRNPYRSNCRKAARAHS